MTLSKSARYALYAALEMARAGEGLVTAAAVAARYGVPATAAAKVFQQLVRAGLAEGVRGVGGGYRLARPRSRVTVLDVLSVFEPDLRAPAGPMVVRATRERSPRGGGAHEHDGRQERRVDQRLAEPVQEEARPSLGDRQEECRCEQQEREPAGAGTHGQKGHEPVGRERRQGRHRRGRRAGREADELGGPEQDEEAAAEDGERAARPARVAPGAHDRSTPSRTPRR